MCMAVIVVVQFSRGARMIFRKSMVLLSILLVAGIAVISGCDSDGGVRVLRASAPVVEEQSVAEQSTPSNSVPTVADITDLILVTGQSNALGAGTGYDWTLDKPDSRVFAFTKNGWQVADLHQVWDLNKFPQNFPGGVPSNNFGLHFGKQLVGSESNRVVGFVLVTAPGQPISHWNSDGLFFDQIRSKVSNAINQLPSKSSLDGILWHQGESDGGNDDSYSDALYQLIADFRSESWFDYGRPFICGETARLPVNAQLRKLERDSDPWTACIAAEGLPTRGDETHFSAEALRLMGKRYADKYLQLIR